MTDAPKYFISSSTLVTSTVFNAGDNKEMLRIAPDGFYVRGVKIEQDSDEARKVFEAFSAWMTEMGMIK